MFSQKEKIKVYAVVLLVLSNALIWYAVSREDRGGILTVSFLDVGQGDAVLIDAPSGNQVLLDSGPDGKAVRAVGRALPFYDKSINLALLSHVHSDHMAGFSEVLSGYTFDGFLGAGNENASGYSIFEKEFSDEGAMLIAGKAPERVDLGGGAYLDVLYPFFVASTTDAHKNMIVCRLVYGKTSFLFAGDAEIEEEAELLARYGEALRSDVLKAGHHGSKNATGERFLGTVSPRYAVISVGADNKYGHPAESTVSRLEKFGVKILRTDEAGTIMFKSDGEKVSL